MSHQVDRVLDDVDLAMSTLRRAIRGVPAARQGFKSTHDRMAKQVAELSVSLADSRSLIKGD